MNIDYIAGFFDGEGSAHILVVHRPTSTYGFTFHPRISISQSKPKVLHAIQAYLKMGRFSYREQGISNSWKLSIDGNRDVKRLAELLQGHCFVKDEALGLVLEAINIKLACGGKGKLLPKDSAIKITYILERLQAVNFRSGKEVRYPPALLRQQIEAWDETPYKLARQRALKKACAASQQKHLKETLNG